MSSSSLDDDADRVRILDAAIEVLTELGLSATELADVAERAGTTTETVERHFDSREQLLTAAIFHEEERFAVEVGRHLAHVEGARARLRLLIEESAAEYDVSLWIELWALALHDPTAAEERRRLDDIWRELLASLISAGVTEGVLPSTLDVAMAAATISSMLDGLLVQTTLGDESVPAERAREIAVTQAEAILGASLDPQADVAAGAETRK